MRIRWHKRTPYKQVQRRWFAILPFTWAGTTYWLEYVTVSGYWWFGSVSGTWYWQTEEVIENKTP